MSEAIQNNHDPAKEVKVVTITCPHCDLSPAQISIAGIQFDLLTGHIFFCSSCGKILTIQVTGKQELIADPRFANPRIIGGGRI